MILQPIDINFSLPESPETVSDLWAYVAFFNGYPFYETDLNGVVPNEIPGTYFFVDRIDLSTPDNVRQLIRQDGFLFIGHPVDPGIDVNESTYTPGQFLNIVSEMLSKSFADQLRTYIKCDYEININSIRPLYNSNKYTKATNSSGVEISYSIWI